MSYEFNLSQTSFIKKIYPNNIIPCEELLAQMPVKPIINTYQRMFYSPEKDYISIRIEYLRRRRYYSRVIP
jgi:hypothetical protein